MSTIYSIFGILSLMASQVVISALNPIHRIGYQIVVFQIGAFIFMLLDFYFQGQVYIIVYVGAIAIQFQFIIMMVECNNQDKIETSNIITSEKSNAYNSQILNNNNNKCGKTIIFTSLNNISKNSDIPLSDITSKALFTLLASPVKGDLLNAKMNNYNSVDQYTPKIIDFRIIIKRAMLWLWLLGLLSVIFQVTLIVITKYMGNELALFNIQETYTISAYFYPVWAIDFFNMTDLETQGIMTYVAYPAAQIQIGLTLWAVMIGIISICSPRHR